MTRTFVRVGLGVLMWLGAQGIGVTQQPTKEYIRVNGRIVAIESTAAADFSVSSGATSVTVARNTSTNVTITVAPTAGNLPVQWRSRLPVRCPVE